MTVARFESHGLEPAVEIDSTSADGLRACHLCNGALEMVAAGAPLADVVRTLRCVVEQQVPGSARCGVYLFDSFGLSLTALAAELPADLNAAVCAILARREIALCTCDAEVDSGLVTVDLDADPDWTSGAFGAMALALGYKCFWAASIVNPAGAALGVMVVFLDVSVAPDRFHRELIERAARIAAIAIDRARADAALRRSEAFLLEAQRLSSTGSFSWCVATDEISWSEQMYRIFELSRVEPVTLARVNARIHPEDRALVHEMIERARREGVDLEFEHRLLLPDHSVRHVQLVAHGSRNEDGCFEYIGAVQDITRRRNAEDALGSARSELVHVARILSLAALTASIAHEVNQPLSGIVTNAGTSLRMLTRSPPDIEGAITAANRTLRDGRRAADVIGRLRALFGRKEASSEAVDLNDATKEVVALAEAELRRNRTSVRLELDAALPSVAGDRTQLQQVIMNLLLNASDAMCDVRDRPRQVVIKTECAFSDRVRLSVTDVGVGLEEAAALRLFEPFQTSKAKGMGIGLFVSRSIIESHRGSLQVVANDGPGATFAFLLPTAAPVLVAARFHAGDSASRRESAPAASPRLVAG